MSDWLLRAEGVAVHFDGVKALDGVDLVVESDEILGLIGPNGAGKTTMVNVLSGFQRPSAGRVFLGPADATRWRPDRFARGGLCRSFQGMRLFADLTVIENVVLGALGVGVGLFGARERARELLTRVGLLGRAEVLASALPQGDANLVGICRALAAHPSILLLDEPAAGLNEVESDELLAVLTDLRASLNVALLIVEHDMRLIMRLCSRVHVLDYGKTLAIGTPKEVRANNSVVEAYLGGITGSAHGAA